jgi:hypothetical protein
MRFSAILDISRGDTCNVVSNGQVRSIVIVEVLQNSKDILVSYCQEVNEGRF